MNESEFREKFREFLNDEDRYKKFVATINRDKDNRLLFWQERTIEKFCQQYSLDIPSFNGLRGIFDICELHGSRLENGKVKVFCGHVDYSKDYTKACAELFPNSHLSEVNGPEEMQGKYYNIRFCQTCREAQQKWSKKNA